MRYWRLLWLRLKPFSPTLFLAGLCVLGSAAATMLLVPLARFAAQAFAHLTLSSLNVIVLSLVGLYVIKGLLSFGGAALGNKIALDLTMRLRADLFGHLLGRSLRFLQRQQSADLASRLVQDLALLKDALAVSLAELLPSGAVILYALGAIAWINWRLALFTLLAVPLVGLAIAQFGARQHTLSGHLQARLSDLLVISQESLGAVGVIRAFGREKEERARFETANKAHRQANWAQALVVASQAPVLGMLQTAALGGVLWVGGFEITQGRLTGADLLAFAAAIGIAIDPTLAFSQGWGKLQGAMAAVERVFGLLETHDGLSEPTAPAPLGSVLGQLEFAGVSFAYEPGRPVLKDLSFTVLPGEHVAVVGPSGGGKSTIAALLLRLYDPDSGCVRLDGRDVRSLSNLDLRRAIAYVPQDPLLFACSVAQNVAFGQPNATREAIVEACTAASAHDFIIALPQGYDTPLDERGAGLSGGQRQRIAIARALLVGPQVLILDEASSALDKASEAAVRDAIATVMQNRTTLIISHREGAIEGATRVITLEAGRLAKKRDLLTP